MLACFGLSTEATRRFVLGSIQTQRLKCPYLKKSVSKVKIGMFVLRIIFTRWLQYSFSIFVLDKLLKQKIQSKRAHLMK
jgi:hypothetical protein